MIQEHSRKQQFVIICIDIYCLCETLIYCTVIIGTILMKLIYVKCFTKCYQCNMWYTKAVFKKTLTYITNVKKYIQHIMCIISTT